MSDHNTSQCSIVQERIDSLLDGELNAEQRKAFMSHVDACAQCRQEWHYARMIHDTVQELPPLDCADSALEPVHRLHDAPRPSLLDWIQERLEGLPLFVRYGAPAVAMTVLVMTVWPALFNPQPETPPAVAREINGINGMNGMNGQPPRYSPEEIQQALLELNTAIDYLNQAGRRTELMVSGRFLFTPLQDSLNASFERVGERRREALSDGPI